jgi:hypothetical protein
MYVIAYAALFSQRCTYSIDGIGVIIDGRAFAESIASNPDIALVDIQEVDLSPFVDVLGVPDEIRGNREILTYVRAKRIAHRQVKSARGGT